MLGCILIVPLNESTYSISQYVFGSVLVFVTSNTIEGTNERLHGVYTMTQGTDQNGLCALLRLLPGVAMSLLSKIMPKRLAKGTFNSGFLTTEAGMTGRAVGDVAVTAGGMEGVNFILSNTYLPMTAISLLTIFATWRCYDDLAEDVDDESDTSSDQEKAE